MHVYFSCCHLYYHCNSSELHANVFIPTSDTIAETRRLEAENEELRKEVFRLKQQLILEEIRNGGIGIIMDWRSFVTSTKRHKTYISPFQITSYKPGFFVLWFWIFFGCKIIAIRIHNPESRVSYSLDLLSMILVEQYPVPTEIISPKKSVPPQPVKTTTPATTTTPPSAKTTPSSDTPPVTSASSSTAQPKKTKANKSEKKKGGGGGEGAATAPVDVSRLDMRVGKILKAWKHPDADGLFVEEGMGLERES